VNECVESIHTDDVIVESGDMVNDDNGLGEIDKMVERLGVLDKDDIGKGIREIDKYVVKSIDVIEGENDKIVEKLVEYAEIVPKLVDSVDLDVKESENWEIDKEGIAVCVIDKVDTGISEIDKVGDGEIGKYVKWVESIEIYEKAGDNWVIDKINGGNWEVEDKVDENWDIKCDGGYWEVDIKDGEILVDGRFLQDVKYDFVGVEKLTRWVSVFSEG